MSEVGSKDGTWTFDGDVVRIVPGGDRSVHGLRKALGELTVPLAALAGASFEPGRRGGRLRLRLRDGADPLTVATGGQLSDAADPFGLRIAADRSGAAEYFVDEVRNALLLDRVPSGSTNRYLLPGPPVPVSATAGDGTVTFDGRTIRLEWNWMVEDLKKGAGAQSLEIGDLTGVEWSPQSGFGWGRLRFRVRGSSITLPPEQDPHSLAWGLRKQGGNTPLVAAAVVARLPHPNAGLPDAATPAEPSHPEAEPAEPTGAGGAGALPASAPDEPGVPAANATSPDGAADVVLRRLRELGELHRDGVLTDEEFTTAKQALLRQL